MILFNITIKVEHGVHNDFIHWVDGDVLRESVDGTEQASRFFRLLGVDASDGITYCLQHYFTDLEAFNLFKSKGELSFRADLADRYGDKLVVFSSVLSEV